MRKSVMLALWILMVALPVGRVAAQSCSSLQRTIQSNGPSTGALASIEHVMRVLKAAITALDAQCEFAIRGLDDDQIFVQKSNYETKLREFRRQCKQLTVGGGCNE